MASSSPCFLEHQLVKPTAIILIITFVGLVVWVGTQHVARAHTELAGITSGKPILGFQIINPDELVARMFSFPPGEVVLVNQVFDGSPAQRAGLRRGDGIVAIDGKSIRSTSDVTGVLSQVKHGDLLRLTVIRGGLVENLMLPTNAPGGQGAM